MNFPHANQLALPCRLEQIVPGALHPDGRRYLPLLVFRLANGFELGVVDRHHRVRESHVGGAGVARLVFLLSTLRLQTNQHVAGLFAETGMAGRPSTRPMARGQVVSVLSWEAERDHLPYESLYAELLLDIGLGIIGVRTSATAESLAASIGKAQLEPGDWLIVERSRIDILEFVPK